MKTLYIYDFIKKLQKTALVDALVQGAEKHGYSVQLISCVHKKYDLDSSDILCIWNRHLNQDQLARRFEAVKARVWVFENPYINLQTPEPWFSVGFSFHNNKMFAPIQRDNDRWKTFNKEIKDWKFGGDHYLVCTQAKVWNSAGLGFDRYKQPTNWDERTCAALRNKTKSTILFRQHPKSRERGRTRGMPNYISVSDGTKPIQSDLENAIATVVYTSNAATESLLEGVPVIVTGPTVFGMISCSSSIGDVIYTNTREQVFAHMAWAQYSVSEISSGWFQEICA